MNFAIWLSCKLHRLDDIGYTFVILEPIIHGTQIYIYVTYQAKLFITTV